MKWRVPPGVGCCWAENASGVGWELSTREMTQCVFVSG